MSLALRPYIAETQLAVLNAMPDSMKLLDRPGRAFVADYAIHSRLRRVESRARGFKLTRVTQMEK